MNVLLIEPDAKLAAIYSQALTTAGHVVRHSQLAQQAVHEAEDFMSAVVVLELQLVGHNGIEFLYEFRSYAEWKDIPVVLLTMVAPHALGITKELLDQFGIVDVLYKPATNLRQLVQSVEGAVE
jgi:DNA-binding response OmpR family regulator